MEKQEALFGMSVVGTDHDHALARFTDPATSQQADAQLREREGDATEIRKGTHRHRALACFGVHGELIAEDVVTYTHIEGIWKRVSDLKNNGFIEKTGVVRLSRQGRFQDVYRLTESGRAAYVKLGPI